MTCVVAIVEGETIYAGADSAVAGQAEIYEMKEPKVFVRGSYLVGFCGSALVGQILRHRAELPEPPADDEDLSSFLVREVMPALRRAVETEGANGPSHAFLGDKVMLVLGCRGRLWCVLPDLTLTAATPHAAIGSGRHHAYGALHALTAARVEPARRRVELALAAAAALTPNVRPPFHFVSLAAPDEPADGRTSAAP